MKEYLKSYFRKIFDEGQYQRLRTLCSRMDDSLSFMSIDVSGMCNLNCAICSFQKWFDEKGLMPLETFKKLERSLMSVKYLALQCNCEPLLNESIIEMIDFAKMVNKAVRIGFITNGTLLDHAMISRLLKAGLNEICVSVDGATKKTFEAIRMGANFESVTGNIKEIVSQKKSSQNCLESVKLITVASRLNVHELSGILDLAKGLEVDGMIVNGMDAYCEEMAPNSLYARSEEGVNSEYRSIFLKLKEKARGYKIELMVPSLAAIPYRSCELRGCVINWNGDVSPCPLLSYERPYWYFGEKLTHPRVTFGNINKNTLFDIWNSGEYKNFRKNLRSGRLPAYCQNCLWQNRVLCG